MKRKNQNLFLCLIILSTILFSACDMIKISPSDQNSGGIVLTESERDKLEKTGHYLKLVNLPLYTQISNVYSVSVANSLTAVARFDRDKSVMLYRETDTCSIYIPLVYNDNKEFLETGFFYTSFSIHVDALTKYIVDASEFFVVHFMDGRGQADVNNLPSTTVNIENRPCLTVYNLPTSVSIYNFSNVLVHSQTGPVAYCSDYSQIFLSISDNRVSAKIPLHYNSLNQNFSETGVFYVSFDINVDVETRFTLTSDDKVKVTFINGSGYIDIQNIPDNPVSYLTIKGLPLNAAKHHISKINVYNSSGPVADCPDYKFIFVVKDMEFSSFLIPLSYVSDGGYFQDSGKFLVSFEINVDIDTQIIFTRADNLFLSFTNGSAEFDIKKYVKINPDDVSLNSNSGIEITEIEKDRLERTGHYLKLVNMPLNTQAPNFFSVSIANSSSSIAKLNNSAIFIYKETDTCTVYLPLVYNDNNDFLETGFFFVSFIIHIDAVTKYIVDISDRFLVYFVYGRGQADVNNLSTDSNSAVPPSPSVNIELTEIERDEIEKTGHYLKLINLPLNTQAMNVFSVSVANSSSAVANLNKNKPVMIFRENNSCSLYLPLVYDNDNDFLETGSFFTAFTIHVDAVTKFIVNLNDRFLVSYSDGRGQADVSNLPSKALVIDEPHYLTISNLPLSVSIYNFEGVYILNQSGVVARCADYSQIVLSTVEKSVTAQIPLFYNSINQIFNGNGVFYVSFDINIDAETRFTIFPDDKVKVTFINGNGFLDINNVPNNPIPYLSIKGLPLNATKKQISNVNVYNLARSVAECAEYKDIIVVKEYDLLTFLVPLSYSDGGFFLDSGRFVITFTFNIDIDTQIVYSRDDNLIVSFINGSAEFDINSFYGFFDAVLTNMNNSDKPIIKAGSSFDVNGNRCIVKNDTFVNALTPSSSCLLFLYVYYADNEFFYEFSSTVPVYNSKYKGWYNGKRRALWKMIFLYNSNPSEFLFKTYVNDSFPQFNKSVLSDSDYSQLTAAKLVVKSIDGAGNPAADSFTLDPGVYVVELKGAGGGAGRSYISTSIGGTGGFIREIFTLNSTTSFTAFTGSGGGAAPAVSTSGTFNIVTTINAYDYRLNAGSMGNGTYVSDLKYVSSNEVVNSMTINNTNSSMSGGGGGGGGSGSFLYSSGSNGNYLLLAGGGGGGSGGSYLTPGGAGGAGGSFGPGAGGGRSGSFSQTSDVGNGNFSSPGGPGGQGGGFGGGIGGVISTAVSGNGGDSLSFLSSNTFTLGGSGVPSYTSSDFNIMPYVSFACYPLSESGKPYTSTPPYAVSDNKALSVRTNFTFSGNSGSGGNAATLTFSMGPQVWLDSNSAGGSGASPLPLINIFITGTYDRPPYKPANTDLTLTIGLPRPGQGGSHGGNNRNSTKGGGAGSGAAGSVIIRKIY